MSAWPWIAGAEAVAATCAFAVMAIRLDGYRLALRMTMAELARKREADLFHDHHERLRSGAAAQESSAPG